MSVFFSFITSLSHLSWLTVKMSVSNTWDISVPTGIFSCPFSKILNAFICVDYLGFSIVALTIWERTLLKKAQCAIVANLRKTRYFPKNVVSKSPFCLPCLQLLYIFSMFIQIFRFFSKFVCSLLKKVGKNLPWDFFIQFKLHQKWVESLNLFEEKNWVISEVESIVILFEISKILLFHLTSLLM